MDWQPIETAPKDETVFLAWFLDGPVIARWSTHYGRFVGLNVKGYDGGQTVQWLADGLNRGGPTHWAPISPPDQGER